MSTATGIFGTVPNKDFLSFGLGGSLRYKEVIDYLDFKKEDVSKALGVPRESVRFDNRIPMEVADRIREWAVLLNLVAQHFKGDAKKTSLWFKIQNPQFGDLAPRDMLRLGRFGKLHRFVLNALEENERTRETTASRGKKGRRRHGGG
jgi:hypothetical protein